jgi:hypothetical protein
MTKHMTGSRQEWLAARLDARGREGTLVGGGNHAACLGNPLTVER